MNNPPAFPQPITKDVHGNLITSDSLDVSQAGMSLRDYFAAMAMQGMLSNDADNYKFNNLARASYEAADAMLITRDKKP